MRPTSPDAAQNVPASLRPTRVASLRRRLVAAVYEMLLLTAIAILVGFVTLPSVGPRPSSVAINAPIPLPSHSGRIISFAALFLAWGAYCVGFWSSGRRSLPMKTWKLVLETRSGTAISVGTASVRYLACWIGPLCAIGAYALLHPYGAGAWAAMLVVLNYLWALIDPQRQLLQDRLAGSRLLLRSATPA